MTKEKSNHIKLAAILRIKDEKLTIKHCLEKLSSLVDEIYIVDNGSTDGTKEIYKNFSKVVVVLETEDFDEGRDKILLLDMVKKSSADWVLWFDGDEFFESAVTRSTLELYTQKGYTRIAFRLCHFWLSKQYCRIDGKYFLYSLVPQVRMWKNTEQSFFQNKKIHNGDIKGIDGPILYSPYRIKHYGYIDREKVFKKFKLYSNIDKTGTRTYDHINPDVKIVKYKFLEFENHFINNIFITLNKLFLDSLWYLIRLYLKIKNLF